MICKNANAFFFYTVPIRTLQSWTFFNKTKNSILLKLKIGK